MNQIRSHQLLKRSRYSSIKLALDEDLFNNNWSEVDTTKVSTKKSNINFIDLFSGAGGISLGFQKAGLNKIASFEIDKDASETIRNNFKNSMHFQEDLTKFTNKKLEKLFKNKKIDILCGGPPCMVFRLQVIEIQKTQEIFYLENLLDF